MIPVKNDLCKNSYVPTFFHLDQSMYFMQVKCVNNVYLQASMLCLKGTMFVTFFVTYMYIKVQK